MKLKVGYEKIKGFSSPVKKAELGFFDYMKGFFAEGFGWLILGLVAICGLLYLFGVVK